MFKKNIFLTHVYDILEPWTCLESTVLSEDGGGHAS